MMVLHAPALAAECVIDAGKALIRQHGPAMPIVPGVARASGMSHGDVSRRFAGKAARLELPVALLLAGLAAGRPA